MKYINLTALALLTIFALSCNSENSSTQPAQGELAQEFTQDTSTTDIMLTDSTVTSPPDPIKTQEEKLKEDGWVNQNISNGVMPNCYNYIPQYGSLDNKLEVSVGGGTNVVIKVMSLATERCVRYVFINSGNVYSIKNIPEGSYYLKIAYGSNWISKTENGKCTGRFLSNALYEKGEDVLDFNKQITADGYNVPSFSLSLDVISQSPSNTFNSNNISEEDFNI